MNLRRRWGPKIPLILVGFGFGIIFNITQRLITSSEKSQASSSTNHNSQYTVVYSCQSTVGPQLKDITNNLIELQRSYFTSPDNFRKIGNQIQSVMNILKHINDTALQAMEQTRQSKPKEVCPEEYKGKLLDYGYPYFRKGFGPVDCKEFIPVEKLVTLLINIPREHSKPGQSYLEVMQNIAKYFGKIRVILATEIPLNTNLKDSIAKLDISFENIVTGTMLQSAIWNKLVAKVTTPYLLIAENITHFDDDINLERLVRVLSYEPDVLIAGGAHRNLKGEWDMGCQQIVFKNWTASYQGGYYRSFNDCVVCDHISGPFMTKTATLKNIRFDEKLKFGAFHDLFWRTRKENEGKLLVSCPDIMFNIGDRQVNDAEYANFASKHNIHKIIEPSGKVRWYGCRRGYSHTSERSCKKTKTIGLSPADLENLAEAIHYFMKACHKAGAFCQICSGTALGAVKFNAILPWEADADIAFEPSNYSVLLGLAGEMKKAGYTLKPGYRPKIKNGRLDGGYMELYVTHWVFQLIGEASLESTVAVSRGQTPTKVLLTGKWVTTARNPGLFARNHYGAGMYQHQEHWRSVGRKSSWLFYQPGSFMKCSDPEHSACLDRYPADGNMQFRNYPN